VADPEKKQSVEDLEAEVWNAIAAFEQILEAMPTDRVSLQTLSDAYERVGDHTRAKDYLMRLANVLLDENDVDGAGGLLGRLAKYKDEDLEAAELIARIEALGPATAEAGAASNKASKEDDAAERHAAVNITSELAFAWNLLQARELTQEEYSRVVEQLSDASTANLLSTVSVLHVLQDQDYVSLPQVIAFAGKECSTPVVSLSSFELRPEAVSLLPLDFVVRRGALVFEVMGAHCLVAVMNPYDQQLRQDVESTSGRPCHFYIASPSEFDAAVATIKELAENPMA